MPRGFPPGPLWLISFSFLKGKEDSAKKLQSGWFPPLKLSSRPWILRRQVAHSDPQGMVCTVQEAPDESGTQKGNHNRSSTTVAVLDVQIKIQ